MWSHREETCIIKVLSGLKLWLQNLTQASFTTQIAVIRSVSSVSLLWERWLGLKAELWNWRVLSGTFLTLPCDIVSIKTFHMCLLIRFLITWIWPMIALASRTGRNCYFWVAKSMHWEGSESLSVMPGAYIEEVQFLVLYRKSHTDTGGSASMWQGPYGL